MERLKTKRVSECRLDLTECQVANFCERGKQTSDSIKRRKILHFLNINSETDYEV